MSRNKVSEVTFEIIAGKFPRTEIKSFQMDVDEGRNNYEIVLLHI